MSKWRWSMNCCFLARHGSTEGTRVQDSRVSNTRAVEEHSRLRKLGIAQPDGVSDSGLRGQEGVDVEAGARSWRALSLLNSVERQANQCCPLPNNRLYKLIKKWRPTLDSCCNRWRPRKTSCWRRRPQTWEPWRNWRLSETSFRSPQMVSLSSSCQQGHIRGCDGFWFL